MNKNKSFFEKFDDFHNKLVSWQNIDKVLTIFKKAFVIAVHFALYTLGTVFAMIIVHSLLMNNTELSQFQIKVVVTLIFLISFIVYYLCDLNYTPEDTKKNDLSDSSISYRLLKPNLQEEILSKLEIEYLFIKKKYHINHIRLFLEEVDPKIVFTPDMSSIVFNDVEIPSCKYVYLTRPYFESHFPLWLEEKRKNQNPNNE